MHRCAKKKHGEEDDDLDVLSLLLNPVYLN